MIITEIIHHTIEPFSSPDSNTDTGAELVFNGRVRDREDGQQIIALEYEHYHGMAEQELNGLAHRTIKKFPIRDLFCRHRVGKVPVGEIAIHIVIRSKHRAEGLEAMAWFVSELKKHVPIWKWAILPDGSKRPGRYQSE